MNAEQVNINAWPYIVSAHELLELSLKALIRARDSSYQDSRMKNDGHDLAKIYVSLERADADNQDIERIAAGYRAYASLHTGIPYCTLQDFLHGVKSDYALWRYYPLQGWQNKTPSKTSPHIMLEVIQHINDTIAKYVATDQGLKPVGSRLTFSLKKRFERHLQDVAVEILPSIVPKDKTIEWLRRTPGFLNNISVTLRKQKRYKISLRNQSIDPIIIPAIERTLDDLSDTTLKFPYAGKHNVESFYDRSINDYTPLIWNGSEFTNE